MPLNLIYIQLIELQIFKYDFMRNAFITALLLSITCACLGQVMVLKRLSMTGDALSHNSLAGVALGFILSINPTIGAMIIAVFAAFTIEFLRTLFPRYAEIGIAILMSLGIGLAAVLSGFTPTYANFNSFLFGSLVAVSNFELYFVISLTVFVLLVYTLLYKELFYICFDEKGAKLAGIRVKAVSAVFTLITAITISVAARTAGTLIVSSLMVLPFATAMLFKQSYFRTLIISMFFGMFNCSVGLFLSFYQYLSTGGTIVLVSVASLTVVALIRSLAVLRRRLLMKKASDDAVHR